MPTCFALFCEHDSRKDKCKMFRFPSNEKQRKQWISSTRNINVHWKKGSRICSCHFVNEKKQNGPTIFAWTSYISKIRRRLDKPDAKELRAATKSIIPPESIKQEHTVSISDPPLPPPSKTRSERPRRKYTRKILNESLPKKETRPRVKVKTEPIEQQSVQDVDDPVPIPDDVSKNPRVISLRVENLILAHEIDELEKQMQEYQENESYSYERLTHEKLIGNDALVMIYTGLPTMSVFKYVVSKLAEFQFKYDKWSVINLHIEEQLLMAMMKLRCNFGFSDIAYRFRVSASTVKNIVWTFVDALHTIFFEQGLKKKEFISYNDNKSDLPAELLPFPNCKILLGSVVIECESHQIDSSPESKHKTLKGLIGISPIGEVIFVSALYPEGDSYEEILHRSNIVDKLSDGDLVICEEDFEIDSNTLPEGVEVKFPGLENETMKELNMLADVLNATTHVTNAVSKLRKFAVLDKILYPYRNNAYRIFQLCATLINFENLVVEAPLNLV